MHEAALIRGVVARALAAAGDDRVAAVHLRVGALAAESPAHLRFHFAAAVTGTAAAGARLVIERETDPAAAGALGVRLAAVDVERD